MFRQLIASTPLSLIITAHLAVVGLTRDSLAAEYLVSSASQIASRLATIQPGDTLVMANGTWTNQRIALAASGTEAMPITLRAESAGGVILNGNSKVSISGSHLIVDGLRFEGGALAASDHIVEFRGSLGSATNSRLTNSTIVDYNPASIDTRYFWVSLYGQNNRVDHNRFEGQNHSGVTVVVWRPNGAADHHLIDSNHFLDRPVGDDNGFETIRIGDSNQSLSNSFTTVESNLFERVDGEIEIISNKSGSNTFRYNTFRESAGTLTLRHGNDNLVEGNFFLGNNKDQTGGIRVIGERQTIINNYIEGLDNRAGGAISISSGVPGSALNEYYQVVDAVIAHNTVIDTMGAAITFDDGFGSSGRTLLAQNVTIANNLFKNSGPTIFEGAQGPGWQWQGNLAFGGGLGPLAGNPGVSAVDPQLSLAADGLRRPGATSPAINAGGSAMSGLLTTDMDGQLRTGEYDIGADEVSAGGVARRALTAADVGPAWLAPTFFAADFNRDGNVDGADLATWSNSFGAAGGAPPGAGDANGDGAIDGSDFLIWQQQVNVSANQSSSLLSVPEPSTYSLIVGAFLLRMPRQRRR